MPQNTVSVIIPVYNVEAFLEECIESVLKQTHPDIELLLINDGSTDRSGEICDRFANEDNRIRVIHQPNSGPSAARNNGLQAATGEYIQFIDADDTIHPEMIERFMASIGSHSLLISGYCSVLKQNGEIYHSIQNQLPLIGEFSKQEFLVNFTDLYPHFFIHYVWNKFYRTSFIKEAGLQFNPRVDWGEDLLFNLEVIERCSSIRLVEGGLYNYTHSNTESITSQFREDFFDNMQMMQNMTRDFLKRNGCYHGYIKDNFERYYTSRVMLVFWNLFHPKSTLMEIEKKQQITRIVQDDQVKESLAYFYDAEEDKRLVGNMIHQQMIDQLYDFFAVKSQVRMQQESKEEKWI
ncbi:glycosyltransferase family 2 protein [Planococcus shixiaomingii]|uniref:glycosyltransferase family 2 protein n=1 Tax=Planococcus shixiaomingii TaxID=3058393 RepID=UPI0026196166|nr:glycosyltransferase [Planococcus sp. N022]WKA53230.1 glycosyltransferase [Planococcus sp. N022]